VNVGSNCRKYITMKQPKKFIDFLKSKEKLISMLDNRDNAVMVLGTSAHNKVITRSILVINDGLDLFFFTWKNARKTKQIEINNSVSLCRDKIEIEGDAKILGLMTAEENKNILDLIRKKHPEAVKRWELKPNMIIVMIKPTFACIDGYNENTESYLEYIDFINQESFKTKWAYY
jgi:general stress protein 26